MVEFVSIVVHGNCSVEMPIPFYFCSSLKFFPFHAWRHRSSRSCLSLFRPNMVRLLIASHVSLSDLLHVCLFVCLFVCLSVLLFCFVLFWFVLFCFVCLFVCVPVCLSVCPSVCIVAALHITQGIWMDLG